VLGLDAELKVALAPDLEPLEERRIHVPPARAAQLVAAEVAERALGGPSERAARRADRDHVEVGRREAVPASHLRVADEVGTVWTRLTIRAGVAIARAALQRQTALDGRRRVDLPAAEDRVPLGDAQRGRAPQHDDVPTHDAARP